MLPYYTSRHQISYYRVYAGCPGCGNLDFTHLSIRMERDEKRNRRYYVGCNCGWCGPYGATIEEAVTKWNAREKESKC